MAFKHKNTTYKPAAEIPNPFQEGQDKAYADLLLDAIKSKNLWQKSFFANLGFFILALILFLVAISQQQVVPVLVNVMPSGESQYLGEVRQTGAIQVPEQAIHYQIRLFITNMRTISTDYMVVYKNIEDCFFMISQSYTPIFRNLINQNSPFELVGKMRRTIDIESVLLVTGRSYQINWNETIIESSANQIITKHRAVITILLATPNPQTITKNPLGIYIENLEMIEL